MMKPILLKFALAAMLVASFKLHATPHRIAWPGFLEANSFDSEAALFASNTIAVKRGEKYDEAKDPALRRGTENEEQPQGSFFAVPAVLLGIVGLVLFFTRDKE